MVNKKIALITDVNSPYRDHLFSLLSDRFDKSKYEFLVFFMSDNSKIRNWDNKKLGQKYKNFISKSYKISFGMHEFHFNLDIIKFVIKNKNKYNFVIGGSWNAPTTLVISILIFIKFLNKECFYLWSESNFKSFVFKNSFFRILRKFFISNFIKFIVPGKIAVKSIKLIIGNKNNLNFIKLPNIIDEKKFNHSNVLNKNKEFIAFWPARLHENSKGIINFLDRSKDIILQNKKLKIWIAGTGPDEKKIVNSISKFGLENKVFLTGYLSEIEMIKKYKESDFFLLASLRDPCPLSVVEALWMSKPLLISNHCGNISEALVESKNGFSFDPLSSKSIKNNLDLMLNLTKKDLKNFGNYSLKIAKSNFESKKCVENFVNTMICS